MQEKNISRFDFEQCQKCNICSTVCPMAEVNPLYPGPKMAGPDEERFRLKDPEFFDMALKYCLNCKRCEVACPSGVKVADLIAEAKMKHRGARHIVRDWTLANTDLVGSLATPFAPLVNGVLSNRTVASVMDGALGVDKRRTFPAYTQQRFVNWFRREAPSQEGFKRYVSYFHGCYVNYNYPELGHDFVTLMNACGVGVRLLDGEKCCGTALIANGFRAQARGQAKGNITAMRAALDSGSEAILTSSSSCTYTMRSDYPLLLGVESAPVRDALMLATRYLYEKVEAGEIKLVFRPGFRSHLAYHTACHMQRLGWQIFSIGLLKMIPGLTLEVLPQQCCGIAGTFGFKKENYAYSQRIGSKLFDSIRNARVAAVTTDCETCKWQIEMSTGLKVRNPLSVLLMALDLDATAAANK